MIGQRLCLGDTIGIICPSSAEDINIIKNKIEFFKEQGFNIKEGKYIYKRLGYLAGTDKERAEDLNNMFVDPNVKMILCVRGGYGSMRTLPYIDFNIIKNNPKIFVGFSDITTYLNSFYTKCNLISFHGPMINSKFDDIFTLDSLLNTVMNGYKNLIIKNPDNIPIKSNSTKHIQGTLVGGNLSMICNTLSTDFEIDTRDKILFIEDVGEQPYAIDRMFTHLLLANKLQVCKGIILGQFTNCSLPHYERSLTLEEIIQDRILSLNLPIVLNFMSGHDYPKLTLPIGANIDLNCKDGTIKVLESVVS
ncbi:LD-carboxypeptidase family protein [Clostridium pasteurianum DSM 525 = ATCC 6013]|uniref:LD-carboxypeptidase family protein n=1 Tax=Clostridium pasteurianum DSM 525 = ATCC 6013 TaxID=1262449 RepID=A0A0H3J0L9_CLOPA|nr:LD-carboxypeptidase [Clostridium pasteurianum]AJA46212.1 LD-carboxypeptidase family protein [Clostridium pasteurianum DSM 525 = ATCC 6013]AJA50200.1 LD-carboxypeptidase family protein [Clostridium pasteurianum DSM 525 = ATCC 6013]AOZ73668.1 LD-carboxypeptidase [Clostridium pasteurianum DSM 525 = ATCC 6013]AOZ77465.1 LD-carboxypeptidase [Clostridium pasteurianum]ELP60797.1 LD-carboxypeptidase A family protein [Clostridium pasteurianum DSM 525 = ATCC 6013]